MDYTKTMTGRAAAVTTTGEVASRAWSCDNSDNGAITVDLRHTRGGSETVTIRFYVSYNGTDYVLVTDDANGSSEAHTTSVNKLYCFSALPGAKFFRCTIQSDSTVSSETIYYYWFQRGSQR